MVIYRQLLLQQPPEIPTPPPAGPCPVAGIFPVSCVRAHMRCAITTLQSNKLLYTFYTLHTNKTLPLTKHTPEQKCIITTNITHYYT